MKFISTLLSSTYKNGVKIFSLHTASMAKFAAGNFSLHQNGASLP